MTEEEIAVKIAEHGKEIGSLKHRVCELEEQNNVIQELALSVQKLALNIESMVKEQERYSKTQEKIFQRIEALEDKPAKHWETVITVIITSLVSGIVACIIANIF